MITFDQGGTSVANPFLSECGRFDVAPSEYGFEAADTGGGAKALIKMLPEGDAIWITDESGMSIPDTADDAWIGYFDADGQQRAFHKVPTESDISEFQNRRYLARWGDEFSTPGIQIVEISFFSTKNGYEIADTVAIAQLLDCEVWKSTTYQTHTVRVRRPFEAEFANYDDELPVFGPFLIDTSYRNDACPSFTWKDEKDPDLGDCRIVLWCDFNATDLRETGSEAAERFNLVVHDRASDDPLCSPVSAATIDELREQCNRWYEENVGYRPDTEEDDIPIGKLVMNIGQMAFLHAANHADKNQENAASEQDKVYPKCIVLCTNSNGAPEFHTCCPEVTQEQYDNGEHYELAKQNAEFNGYERPMIAFDAKDPAAKQLGAMLTWL